MKAVAAIFINIYECENSWYTDENIFNVCLDSEVPMSCLIFFFVSSPGNIDKVDLSKLNQIDESLKSAKSKMANSDLDRKLAELNDVAKTQENMINDYDRQIREIRADIANLNDIKSTLPDGCFNTPSLERP